MVGPVLIAAAGSAAAGAMAWTVRGRSSAVFGPSVWHGNRNRRSVALTFDDGPSESTLELLDMLSEYRVRATFFQCGCHVRRLAEVARAVRDGSHEIGNHTENHPKLYFRSPAFIRDELELAQEAIVSSTGVTPVLFRAPYGVRWPGLRAAQQRLGLMGVMWTVIGCDWRLPIGKIVDRVLRGGHNGAIFCLHDGREREVKPDIRPTLEAVRRIIPALLERGYAFETVSRVLR